MVAPLPAHQPVVRHTTLKTSFVGIQHTLSTPDAPVYQFRGIKYASLPARFRHSRLFTAYHTRTDAFRYGPVCPQPHGKSMEEELFGFEEDEFPVQNLKQIESECLNLNITVPAGATKDSRLPVMVWVHGGGNRGSGNHWLFDGGALVQNSIRLGKPVILVTFNYRLGFLGCAAGNPLKEDNGTEMEIGGDGECHGVGNYGLRDQRRALEWVHHFIGDFGGDPANVTLFGEGSGAADVLCHLASRDNARTPLFARAIAQSPLFDAHVPTVPVAGASLSRIMSALHVHTMDELRKVDVDKLVVHTLPHRVVDDGVWFCEGWRELLGLSDPPQHHYLVVPEPSCPLITATDRVLLEHNGHAVSQTTGIKKNHPHVAHSLGHSLTHGHRHMHAHSHSRSRSRSPGSSMACQPIIIGDCGFESYQFAEPASEWNASAVHRRVKAIAQNLHRTNALLKAYDASAHTPEDELADRLLELINDARFAWPTHRAATALAAHGTAVWRYVFDQEAPKRAVPHHGTDLLYLFDNARPASMSEDPDVSCEPAADYFPESFSDSDSDDGMGSGGFDNSAFASAVVDEGWGVPVVDAWTYTRVRDALQGRWFTFAHGTAPWGADKVYVFGPEGETGERSADIFEGRRRTARWKSVLSPLGRDMVLKIGIELSNGPPGSQK